MTTQATKTRPTPNDALALLDLCKGALREKAQRRSEVADKVARFQGEVAQCRWPEDDADEEPEWTQKDTADGTVWTDGYSTAWVERVDGRLYLTVGDTDGRDGRGVPLAALWAIMRDDEDDTP